MNIFIIYSSQFGNTEKIAKAIGEGLTQYGEVKVLPVAQAAVIDWNSLDILVVGSPTQGGRATKDVQDFLNKIPAGALKNKKVAAFDTRFAKKDHNFALQLLMKVIDYAASKIAKILKKTILEKLILSIDKMGLGDKSSKSFLEYLKEM